VAVKKSPAGMGAADAFILKRFPDEVRAYRSKCNHLNICLLVMIDADPPESYTSHKSRIGTLKDSLHEAGIAPIEPHERIAILVSRRNLESWMHFMTTDEIDEETDYRHAHQDNECKESGQRLKQIQMQHRAGTAPAAQLPPSLAEAVVQLERICHCR